MNKLSNFPQKTSHPNVWYYEEKGRIRVCIDGSKIPENYTEITIRASKLKNNLRRISK